MCFRPPTVGQEANICPQCGTENFAGARKCKECGLTADDLAPTAAPAAPPSGTVMPKAPNAPSGPPKAPGAPQAPGVLQA